MMRNRASWLALLVLAIATVLMVFFVLPRVTGDKQPIGDAINDAGKTVRDAVAPGGESAGNLIDPAGAGKAEPPAGAATDTADNSGGIPAFDVLRVEPDGSTVIAGRATPGARLEILDGDKVVSSAQVGATGDFAAVLDTPLPAGDHQLTLKATNKDGASTVSQEVATVSVPKDKASDLLAMVTKPGEASRIITAPEGSAAATGNSAIDGTAGTAGSGTSFATAPAAGGQSAISGAKPSADANATPEVQVTAVEIEADRIFVAGLAKPQASVAAYADDRLIGHAFAAANGHFVVEGRLDLSVGSHTISADVLDASGKVTVRAAVPFNRPQGEQVAVVAQPSASQTAAGMTMTLLDDGAFDKLRNDATKAFALLRNLFADDRTPSAEQLAAARSATEFALKSLAEYRLGADANAAMKEMAARTSAGAAHALAALHALPSDAKAVAAALDTIAKMIEDSLQPALDTPATKKKANVAGAGVKRGDGASPDAAGTEPADLAASGPKTIEQAPLTESKNSVIIRRGDTLWQISRRVYGKGIRYTTIYIANKDQIANPDIIQPGQIFGLPSQALPDSEQIHKKHLSGEAVN